MCIRDRWGAADAEIIVSSIEITDLKVLPVKRGVGQYIAIHVTPTARDFFLSYSTLPMHSPAVFFFFFPNLSRVFPVLAVANTSSCEGPPNKTGHPAGCRFPC